MCVLYMWLIKPFVQTQFANDQGRFKQGGHFSDNGDMQFFEGLNGVVNYR